MDDEFIYTLFFTKEEIKKFLEDYSIPETKDYEFVVAVIFHHYFSEKNQRNKYWIGFKIRLDYLKILPSRGSKEPRKLSEIAELFRKGIDENSIIDFIIAKEVNIKKAEVKTFQVKRFGIGRTKKDTNELIAYLKNLFMRKYGKKAKTDLVVVLDNGVNIDMKKLYAEINTVNNPFDRVLFIWFDDKMVYLSHVYPRGGIEKCPIIDIFPTLTL
ncbi:MAG: hypothetical protein HYY86_02755 [Candidatus Harrisonbacteria bacterium]|nr:hypothetical protein [Candidatus Harrisonbacteria bacterium]